MHETSMTPQKLKLDPHAIRAEFPILATIKRGKRLVYLDSAATSQKPLTVLTAMDDYYRKHEANVHRGVYTLSEAATAAYEGARAAVATFIRATAPEEIIFTRNTTEAINLVASCWGKHRLKPGDAILTSVMEHHAVIVPWQRIAAECGARMLYLPLDEQGRLDLTQLDTMLEQSVKMVVLAQTNNAIGTINPLPEIITRAHAAGALVLVDGAQSVPHMATDVRALDCDFLAFSAHKMCGPTGIGVLYGRAALLEDMPPFMTGGSMIRTVTLEGTTYADIPQRFEAGTPAIAEAIGLGAAVQYLCGIGMEGIREREQALTAHMLEALAPIPGLTLYGPPLEEHGTSAAFSLTGIHPHDVASLLDEKHIAVRAGHHCCQPLMNTLGVPALTRASVAFYNTFDEIDTLVHGIQRVQRILGTEQE